MKSDSQYSKKEAQERFEQALRGAVKTPPHPLKEKPKTGPKKPRIDTPSGKR
jgi:hypothetical protein